MEASSVTAYFSEDHDRLDALLARFQQVQPNDASGAAAVFHQFAEGLARHIAWEEQILFPLFEEKTGMHGAGPTEVMRMEHRQIKRWLAEIQQRVDQQVASNAEEAALLHVLGAHNQKEEGILYPAIDEEVTEAERAAIFAQMQQLAAQRTGG